MAVRNAAENSKVIVLEDYNCVGKTQLLKSKARCIWNGETLVPAKLCYKTHIQVQAITVSSLCRKTTLQRCRSAWLLALLHHQKTASS